MAGISSVIARTRPGACRIAYAFLARHEPGAAPRSPILLIHPDVSASPKGRRVGLRASKRLEPATCAIEEPWRVCRLTGSPDESAVSVRKSNSYFVTSTAVMLSAGVVWWQARCANAAMTALAQSGVKFRKIRPCGQAFLYDRQVKRLRPSHYLPASAHRNVARFFAASEQCRIARHSRPNC